MAAIQEHFSVPDVKCAFLSNIFLLKKGGKNI